MEAEATGSTADEWCRKASVSVKNTRRVSADHSVHFYTAPPPETETNLVHPEVSLQAFTKVYQLSPGESRRVEVEMDKHAISHWDEYADTWKAEVGAWTAKIGIDAQMMVAAAKFQVDHAMEWRGL